MAEKHALDRSDDSYAEGGYENGGFKRQRVDSGAAEGYQQRSYQDSEGRSNPHYTEPSPVVHVRGIADEAREQDLLHALSSFGTISCVTMMPKLRQALVEFEDISSAKSLMESGKTIILRGRPAYFNYSKSKSISKNLSVQQELPVNRILLITVINPQYPITTDILHTIFSKQGHVLRIVIFRKSGLQAMVEFASPDQAQQAKDALNGADIYTGCNTLKIEYSRATSLNVYKNDEETFDYTEDKAYGKHTC